MDDVKIVRRDSVRGARLDDVSASILENPAGLVELPYLPPEQPDLPPVAVPDRHPEDANGRPHTSALAAVPDWAQAARAAWQQFEAPDSPEARCQCDGREPPAAGTTSDEAFLHWLDPLLAVAREALNDRLRESAVAGGASLGPRHPLVAPDTARLIVMVKRTLVLDLNVARERGRLCGTTPSDRFACFVAGLTGRPGRKLLAAYPVLVDELIGHLTRWIEVRTEFAVRFEADLPLLRTAFGVTAEDVSAVDDISFGVGDVHRRGRSVAIVSVAGRKVVYKPRPLAVEQHFNEFVGWLNGRGLEHPLRPAAVLDRGAYGWSEYCEPQPCADAGAVDRFYWRQGVYLGVFYLLGGYDMHSSNVIAVGEHPVFVDLEAMFHAPADFEDDDLTGSAVGGALRESVLASLLLPQRQFVADGDRLRGVDVSGLAGDRSVPELKVAYEGDGTDRMRVVRRREELAETGNRPTLAGQGREPSIRAEYLMAGFSECYRLLRANRVVLLAEDGPITPFADDQVRAVLRDTRVYTSLLDESWHPELLTDQQIRRAHFERLAVPGGVGDYPDVLASELRQLAHGDVPVFSFTAGGTALSDPDGVISSNLLNRSGLAWAQSRVLRLSDSDLEVQSSYIAASLATLDPGRRPEIAPVPGMATTASAAPERLLDAARSIADRLVRTALRADPADGPEWVTLNLLDDRYWVLGRTSLGLGSGVLGIALFLAELDAIVGETRYHEVVEDLVRSLLDDNEPPDNADLEGLSIGGFEDLGALLHLIARLRHLWGGDFSPALRWLIPAVQRNIAVTSPLGDVVNGAAGAALALLGLRETDASSQLAVVLEQVVALAAGTVPAGSGFGQGGSGHGYALAAVAAATADRDLFDLALATLSRTCVIPQTHGWCDGLAGEVLARAALWALPSLEAWTDVTQRTALRSDFGRAATTLNGLLMGANGQPMPSTDDSLCHGTLGMAEALRAAGAEFADTDLTTNAQLIAVAVAHRVLAGHVLTGAPSGVWVPGLLTGAAGIGYGLLRAFAPERVPNVLLLKASSAD
ncbi:type 2 lanthipeptide synthetase LanM family protein [Micromonospora aurantiaca]|uniref:type 2 lanthipeptide synthetase LanM family protein n=1 Tax=Micromonospora aurantiaca (nom. illeg.) TaxID=47850 RepID=UPI0034534D95